MLENPDFDTHPLSLERVTQEEFEIYKFSCPQCAFRGEYTLNLANGDHQIEIFDRGDGEAFHYDQDLFMLLLANSFGDQSPRVKILDWGDWLTPKMRNMLGQMPPP